MESIDGIAAIIDEIDLVLVDQFGVLHDGTRPYPCAVQAVDQLKQAGKSVVVISNSGKRAASNISRLGDLGFADHLFDHVVSSGEVAYRYLKSSVEIQELSRCFLISRDGDTTAVDGLGLTLVDDPGQADLIMISGCEPEKSGESDYRTMLQAAALNQVRCLCTNPDKQMLTPAGLSFGAGRIAEIYEELGGTVLWIGKPYPAIYEYILTLYADHERERIVCVGDSIEHDVGGGQRAGLKTMLVRTGISANMHDGELGRLCEETGLEPNYIAHEFRF